MYELTVEDSFSAAHQLCGYKGECEKLHGHNWKVEITIRSEILDELGLVIDFKELKGVLKEVLDKFDHHHLNDLPPFKELNPTTENIAKFLYESLRERIVKPDVNLHMVRVWEGEKSSAAFTISS